MNPDLVGRNPEGQPESVRYEQINAMLLNEFLKEHRKGEKQRCKIQEQETTIAELRSESRKVSAQLRIGNAVAQEIASNPLRFVAGIADTGSRSPCNARPGSSIPSTDALVNIVV